MRKMLIAAVLCLVPALAHAEGQEVRAAPHYTAKQVTTGCITGGSVGGLLGLVGTIGFGVIPGTALGCVIGGAVSPTASDLYDRYSLKTYLAVDDAVTYAYGWWQEQKLKTAF